jgi:hypothetical protein
MESFKMRGYLNQSLLAQWHVIEGELAAAIKNRVNTFRNVE